MTGTTLLRNANYKITSDYNGIFKFDGYDGDMQPRVYVDAQWTILLQLSNSRTELKSL